MSIIINNAIKVNAPKPIDVRIVIGDGQTFLTKEAIPMTERYIGLLVAVIATNGTVLRYELNGGIENINWTLFSGYLGGGSVETDLILNPTEDESRIIVPADYVEASFILFINGIYVREGTYTIEYTTPDKDSGTIIFSFLLEINDEIDLVKILGASAYSGDPEVPGTPILAHPQILERGVDNQHPISAITSLQASLDAKINLTEKGQANGVAPLDSHSLVPDVHLSGFPYGLKKINDTGKIGWVLHGSPSVNTGVNSVNLMISGNALQDNMTYVGGIKYKGYTTSEMNNLVNPEAGTVIWNSTEGAPYYYTGAIWALAKGWDGTYNLIMLDDVKLMSQNNDENIIQPTRSSPTDPIVQDKLLINLGEHETGINIRSVVFEPVVLKNDTSVQAYNADYSNVKNIISRTGNDDNTPITPGDEEGTYNSEVVVGDSEVVTVLRMTDGYNPKVRVGDYGATTDYTLWTEQQQQAAPVPPQDLSTTPTKQEVQAILDYAKDIAETLKVANVFKPSHPEIIGFLLPGHVQFNFETDAGSLYSVTQNGIIRTYGGVGGTQVVSGLDDANEISIKLISNNTYFKFRSNSWLSLNLKEIGDITILLESFKYLELLEVFECDADLSKVTNIRMAWMHCDKLPSFPSINTSSVIYMDAAWYYCYELVSFPAIDTSSVMDIRAAWGYCGKLKCIAGTLDFTNTPELIQAFIYCYALEQPASTGTPVRDGIDALAGIWTNPNPCP